MYKVGCRQNTNTWYLTEAKWFREWFKVFGEILVWERGEGKPVLPIDSALIPIVSFILWAWALCSVRCLCSGRSCRWQPASAGRSCAQWRSMSLPSPVWSGPCMCSLIAQRRRSSRGRQQVCAQNQSGALHRGPGQLPGVSGLEHYSRLISKSDFKCLGFWKGHQLWGTRHPIWMFLLL